jgi:hypothetical protein
MYMTQCLHRSRVIGRILLSVHVEIPPLHAGFTPIEYTTVSLTRLFKRLEVLIEDTNILSITRHRC